MPFSMVQKLVGRWLNTPKSPVHARHVYLVIRLTVARRLRSVACCVSKGILFLNFSRLCGSRNTRPAWQLIESKSRICSSRMYTDLPQVKALRINISYLCWTLRSAMRVSIDAECDYRRRIPKVCTLHSRQYYLCSNHFRMMCRKATHITLLSV